MQERQDKDAEVKWRQRKETRSKECMAVCREDKRTFEMILVSSAKIAVAYVVQT
jgi:hypothetical protein